MNVIVFLAWAWDHAPVIVSLGVLMFVGYRLITKADDEDS